MKTPKYQSGKEVKAGDSVLYHGEPGEVQFLVSGVTGDRSIDWYAKEYPAGGVMIIAKGFGNVFVTDSDMDGGLEFVSRSPL